MLRKRQPAEKRRRRYSRRRFSLKSIDPAIIISVSCILATLIFAIILGNLLGAKAKDSQGGQSVNADPPPHTLPKPDRFDSAIPDIFALSSDMTSADPNESLSNQTSEARTFGNALFIPMQTEHGNMIYSSAVTSSLGIAAQSNLTLSRLRDHFDYWEDYVCGAFVSQLDPDAEPLEKIALRSRELSLLAEATEFGFCELMISFVNTPTVETVALYQSYIAELKLMCPDTPVGIALPARLCADSSHSYLVSALLDFADICFIDLSGEDPSLIEEKIPQLLYVSERYPSRMMLPYSDEETAALIKTALEKHGVSSAVFIK